jgi:hypothetical protein
MTNSSLFFILSQETISNFGTMGMRFLRHRIFGGYQNIPFEFSP